MELETTTRTLRRLAVVALAVPALLALLMVRCGSRPGSPEDLFQTMVALNKAGDTRGIWNLLSPKGREHEIKAIDGLRETIRNNPDPQNIPNLIEKQYRVSWAEFQSMSYVEIYEKEAEPYRGLMDGAQILNVRASSDDPGLKLLTWESRWGDKWIMGCRDLGDGWAFEGQSRTK